MEHTSELPPFRAFPMYCYSSFSRRYIGIKNPMPIPMYVSPNLSIIYIGMGQYRLFPMYRQKLPKQNTSEFSNSWPSRCISNNFPRIYPLSPVVYPRASGQKQTKYIGIQQIIAIPMYQNPSYIGNPSFHPIPMYSKNFPRIYSLSHAVYPRASRKKQTKYIGIPGFHPIPMDL